MRKLIVSTYVTLDGVFENPGDWHFGIFNDEMADFAREQLFAADAVLIGRCTYEVFAATWPSITDEVGFADRMNAMRKYVVSTTLTEARWQNTKIIDRDVAQSVRKIKEQPGQDILLYGSAQLMRSLMRAALIDELRVWIHPFLLGTGDRLFSGIEDPTALTLTDVTRFTNGVVVLTYEPPKAGSEEASDRALPPSRR
jgi:dihydrofolate reductase